VSWSWAALTSVNNAAWLGCFVLSGFWTAIVPAISATVLSGLLAVVLARRGGGTPKRLLMLVSVWAVVLLTAGVAVGRTGLGSALAVAFLLQVAPSVCGVSRMVTLTGIVTAGLMGRSWPSMPPRLQRSRRGFLIGRLAALISGYQPLVAC
jgi:peptidoglycan biosynthesis protein MviN/MurJ (putative lipid II flippase)